MKRPANCIGIGSASLQDNELSIEYSNIPDCSVREIKSVLRNEIDGLNLSVANSLNNLREEPWNPLHIKIILATIQQIITMAKLLEDEVAIQNAVVQKKHYERLQKAYSHFDETKKMFKNLKSS